MVTSDRPSVATPRKKRLKYLPSRSGIVSHGRTARLAQPPRISSTASEAATRKPVDQGTRIATRMVRQATYGRAACYWPTALLPGDERVAQHVGLQLQLVQPVLDDVTDADDALEPSIDDHRQVPHAQPRHPAHHFLEVVVGRARGRRSRHHRRDRK